MKKSVILATLSGYITGVITGAIWVGCADTILIALVSAPLFILLSPNEYIWGQMALVLAFIAILQLFTMIIIGRNSKRPVFSMIGSFIFAGIFGFLGGSTSAAVASV